MSVEALSAVTEAARPRARRRRTTATRFTRTFLLFALPCVVLLVLFNLYPLFFAVWQSLNNGDLAYIHPFVGLLHYGRALVDPLFWRAAAFTVIFTAVGVFGSWAVGLALALFLRTRVPFRGLWRALLLLPWVVPASASAVGWLMFAGPHSPTLTKVVLCLFRLWLGIPFMVMLMSSALDSVDTRVYEAARVDGAGAWQTFTRITLPLISGPVYISWILMTIFCVNDYESVNILGGGNGPNATQTLVTYAYQSANMTGMSLGTGIGQANAIAILTSSLLVAVVVLLFRQTRSGRNDWATDAGGVGSSEPARSRRGEWWRLPVMAAIAAVLLAPLGTTLKFALQFPLGAMAPFRGFGTEWTMFWHSLLLASVTVVFCVCIGAPAAYAVARGRGRGISAFTVLIFAVQSFPTILLLFPMFWIFCVLGLIDQLWTVQLAYVATTLGFAVWMLSAFFRTMPPELEEAAWSDGCSVIGAFFRVILPNAAPALISVGFFVFLFAWGDAQIAGMLMLTAPTPTLGIGDGGSLVFLLPPLVLFLVFSRRINLGGVTTAFARR